MPEDFYHKWTLISTNTTTQVKDKGGYLARIVCGNAGATSNTVSIYDDTDGTDNPIIVFTDMPKGTYEFGLHFPNGLRIVTATGTAPNMCVVWK